MADPIDRQAAIRALDGEIKITGQANAEAVKEYVILVRGRLECLPSAQPEPRWIPVRKRLPGSSGNYLVCTKSIGWNGEEYVVIDIAYWDGSAGFHKAAEVVAWMPLPEAYKGGEK